MRQDVEQLCQRVDNWKFTQALAALPPDTPDRIRILVECLADLLGDVGWFEGTLGKLIEALVELIIASLLIWGARKRRRMTMEYDDDPEVQRYLDRVTARYRLAGTEVVRDRNEDDLAWWLWFKNIDNRRIALTQVTPAIEVSTIFVGIDQDPMCDEPPLVFETMVFHGDHGTYKYLWATYHEAEQGHEAVVERFRHHLASGRPLEELDED
jgi:hypothetical protein